MTLDKARQIASLLRDGALCAVALPFAWYLIIFILPDARQSSRNLALATAHLNRYAEQGGPEMVTALQSAKRIVTTIEPKSARIADDLAAITLRGRRISIAEEEKWNSPERIRARDQMVDGANAAIAQVNRILPIIEGAATDTRGNLNQTFSALNTQLLPETHRSLQALARLLEVETAQLLHEADTAIKQGALTLQTLNALLADPHLPDILADLKRIAGSHVTIAQQMAVMSNYGAEAMQQAPDIARRFNEIVKGAQGWQKVINILRLAAAVAGFVWR